jgi:hypothetical protein
MDGMAPKKKCLCLWRWKSFPALWLMIGRRGEWILPFFRRFTSIGLLLANVVYT